MLTVGVAPDYVDQARAFANELADRLDGAGQDE